ncbi:MAG: hypothetical protein Q8L88_06155 [Bacteroidota bacterium]|nr:hypothetical protein [Bacteroidota bacterium]
MKKLLFVAMLVMTISSLSLAQRVLINNGDQYVGAKLALGSVAGASVGFIGSYEMGYQENIGIGATIGYSGYTESITYFDLSYTNILIMANGNYHIDLLKNEKLDTWGTLSLGYNIQSASATYTGPANLKSFFGTWTGSASSGLLFGLSANARYQLTEKLYASAGLGFGLGLLNIGIDYKL